MKFFLAVALLLSACSSPYPTIDSQWQEISGRENLNPIYRIKLPFSWLQKIPTGDKTDTTVPIAEYYIEENNKQVRITIHNFPSKQIDDRVSPLAQIARWKRQFNRLDQASVSTTPQAYSGYIGLLFEATGEINGNQTTMMGWTMQLTPELYRQSHDSDIRGDFTIKIQGDRNLVEQHKTALIAFARSFELIQAIPLPT